MPAENPTYSDRRMCFFKGISCCFHLLDHSRSTAHGGSRVAPPPVEEEPLQTQNGESSSLGDSAPAVAPLKQSCSEVPFSGSECCPICLNEFNGGVGGWKMLPRCGHVFHKECIDEWLFRSFNCPVCRDQATDDDQELIGKPARSSVLDPSTALVLSFSRSFSGSGGCGRYFMSV